MFVSTVRTEDENTKTTCSFKFVKISQDEYEEITNQISLTMREFDTEENEVLRDKIFNALDEHFSYLACTIEERKTRHNLSLQSAD